MGKSLELPELLEQQLVDGILAGYKDYLSVRRSAQKRLAVSSAYAWVKGNHIDSQVKEKCADIPGIEVKHDLAGYAWEYLQFSYDDANGQSMIIVKNQRAAASNFNEKPQQADPKNYLYQYAGINNELVKKGCLKGKRTGAGVQLELSMPELAAIQQNVTTDQPQGFNRFYIVTYEIDDVKMIKSIRLTMPKQNTMSLFQAADLTPMIAKSGIDITPEELAVVQRDRVPASVYSPDNQPFGYEIPEGEQKKEQ